MVAVSVSLELALGRYVGMAFELAPIVYADTLRPATRVPLNNANGLQHLPMAARHEGAANACTNIAPHDPARDVVSHLND